MLGQWAQFGGPNRNFTVDEGPLDTNWGDEGQRVLWSREFGDGFASLLVDQGVLYGAHRDGDNDVIVAMEASTGKELWSTSYESPTLANMILDFGPGPIATPLLVGDRLFAVSSTVKFHCLDRKTGAILWSHDLMAEMGATHLGRGFGPSPIAYRHRDSDDRGQGCLGRGLRSEERRGGLEKPGLRHRILSSYPGQRRGRDPTDSLLEKPPGRDRSSYRRIALAR